MSSAPPSNQPNAAGHDAQDPSQLLPAANKGAPPLVKLQNISARPELNNQFGQAVSFSSGRYVVALLEPSTAVASMGGRGGVAQPQMMRIKPENLVRASLVDQLRFGTSVAHEWATSYMKQPTTRELGCRIMSYLPPSLQSKLNPERALIGATVAIILAFFLFSFTIVRFIGFTKFMMVFSLIALVLGVSSPDWLSSMKEGKPLGLTLQRSVSNFTMRWKEHLVGMTGYTNISTRLAQASLVFILFFSGKLLLTPSTSASQPPQTKPLNNPNEVSFRDEVSKPPRLYKSPQFDIESMYKLGFDDAKNGQEFGFSLPEGIQAYHAFLEESVSQHQSSQQDFDNTNFEWAYDPPSPPSKQKPNIGMGTFLSIFALFRFGKDLVTSPNGGIVLDVNYIMMRLRSTEPWRLGLLGMSLYRVLSSLKSFF